uniref:Phospho-N-acetylmuramoyl-pentapeptide-transferase n=1 Tax=Kalanchoe fedtschenkoi TaxID=63787 RepID=A0A7N0T4A2_KALFE
MPLPVAQSSSLNLNFYGLGFGYSEKICSAVGRGRLVIFAARCWCSGFKFSSSRRRRLDCLHPVRAMDDDFGGVSMLDDWGENEAGYVLSSSEGEDSDGEIVLNPISDVDLPGIKDKHGLSDDAFRVTSHRFAMMARDGKKHMVKAGVFLNIGLIAFLGALILLVDLYAWRIVRLPLAPFFLARPFLISIVVASCAGYICVPFLQSLKIYEILKRKGPIWRSLKKRTPTMGGIFFVPAGVMVAKFVVGFSSTKVYAAVIATLAFSGVGLVSDIVRLINNRSYGLALPIKILLEISIGAWFSLWLRTATTISSPYGIKTVVPLPAPVGLVCLGNFYFLLTSFCFVSMGSGVNFTDGLDGLAAGTAAVAFIGMAIAVLPICSDLAVFGSSMAGACVGFLLHNRYKASVFMGDTGSLALGGALASMAACTGMFFPLSIASGIFVIEAISVLLQVSYFYATRRIGGDGRRLFRIAPFHYHLRLIGLKEPVIVACAYVISCALSLVAGYTGLISA